MDNQNYYEKKFTSCLASDKSKGEAAQIVIDTYWNTLTLAQSKVTQLSHEFEIKDLREQFLNKNVNEVDQLLIRNCKYIFLKLTYSKNNFGVELNYPLVNFQEEEQNLLEQ